MDPLEFISVCKTLPYFRPTPVVVTATTDEVLRAREPLHSRGGIAVVTKPFQLDPITAIVVPLAHRKRCERIVNSPRRRKQY
jgi:CheY-like chemotaxis protein